MEFIMEFSYKKLWVLLAENSMKKKDLKEKAHLTSTTIARLSKNEPVSMEALGKICLVFKCNIGDIVEVIFNDEEI